jgi:hypothetical protein
MKGLDVIDPLELPCAYVSVTMWMVEHTEVEERVCFGYGRGMKKRNESERGTAEKDQSEDGKWERQRAKEKKNPAKPRAGGPFYTVLMSWFWL